MIFIIIMKSFGQREKCRANEVDPMTYLNTEGKYSLGSWYNERPVNQSLSVNQPIHPFFHFYGISHFTEHPLHSFLSKEQYNTIALLI